MAQREFGDRIRDPVRFVGLERGRLAGAHVAKAAGACAGVAHDHHRGMALRPAFADIRAPGFLTDRNQLIFADNRSGFMIYRMPGRLYPDPRRLALDRIVRTVRLFRMPGRSAHTRGAHECGTGAMIDGQSCRGHAAEIWMPPGWPSSSGER